MTTTYTIDDASNNQLTTGLAEHEARRVAQQMADERGESVWLYADTSADEDGSLRLRVTPGCAALLAEAE